MFGWLIGQLVLQLYFITLHYHPANPYPSSSPLFSSLGGMGVLPHTPTGAHETFVLNLRQPTVQLSEADPDLTTLCFHIANSTTSHRTGTKQGSGLGQGHGLQGLGVVTKSTLAGLKSGAGCDMLHAALRRAMVMRYSL